MAALLTLLSLNMFLLPGPVVHRVGGDYKTERMQQFVREHAAAYDVLALQETFASLTGRQRQLRALLHREAGYEAFFAMPDGDAPHCVGGLLCAHATRAPLLSFDAGLLVAARGSAWQPAATHWLEYADGTGFDAWARKGALHARLRHRGSNGTALCVDVFTTHLQSGGSERKLRVRAAQLRELGAFVQRHASPSCTAVLCGDFNIDYGDTDEMRLLRTTARNALHAVGHAVEALANTSNAAQPRRAAPPTACATGGIMRSLFCAGADERTIDHAYVAAPAHAGALQLCGVRVVPFETHTHGSYHRLSDHRGLELVLCRGSSL